MSKTRGRPSGSGIPLLFPFPGRIQGTTLEWEGKQYQLPEGDGRGNAIHGFALNRPWRVIEQTESRVTAQFQASVDDPQLLECWPADFSLEATYELVGHMLTGTYRAQNPSDTPLPFGLGTHPYFRVPLGGTSAEACEIVVPYTFEWEFQNQLASGNQIPREEGPQQPFPFGETELDNGYGGLALEEGLCTTSIHDPQSGRTLIQTFDGQFSSVVLYTPGHRQAFCIEPYTCIPDAFALHRAGKDGGLRILQPGETFETTVRIGLR